MVVRGQSSSKNIEILESGSKVDAGCDCLGAHPVNSSYSSNMKCLNFVPNILNLDSVQITITISKLWKQSDQKLTYGYQSRQGQADTVYCIYVLNGTSTQMTF